MRKAFGRALRNNRRAVCSLDLKRLGITLINANDNCPLFEIVFILVFQGIPAWRNVGRFFETSFQLVFGVYLALPMFLVGLF